MDFVRFTGIILLSAGICLCVRVQTIAPVKSTGPQAALIVVPGAYIDGIAYKPLANEIQKRSDFKLWVALLDGFFNKLPNPIELPLGFAEAMQGLQMAGFKGKKVFLAGHSLGGEVVDSFSEIQQPQLEGIMLFSSYPLQSLHKYQVPVLTISGDLDGLTRVTLIVDIFEDLERTEKQNPMQHYTTPVIVMEGVNHGQFASGKMPSNVANNDLNPEVSNTVAYDTIANYTNAFMVSARNDSNTTDTDSAEAMLDVGYMVTGSIIKPLSNIKALDQNKEWVSHWTITAQQLVVSLQNTTSVEFVNEEDESVSRRQIKRHFINVNQEDDSDEVKIKSYTTVWLPGINVGVSPVSPLQLKATMMSQEAVKNLLPTSPFGKPATCREINQEAFLLAYSLSSDVAKSRYESNGHKLVFLDDFKVPTIQWPNAFILLDYRRNGLYVSSASFHFNAYKPAGQFGCTLLSPFRAMEWIYIDALRKAYTDNNLMNQS